jgi:hypothetical protein
MVSVDDETSVADEAGQKEEEEKEEEEEERPDEDDKTVGEVGGGSRKANPSKGSPSSFKSAATGARNTPRADGVRPNNDSRERTSNP